MATAARGFIKLARKTGRRGRVIDEDPTLGQARKDAIGPKRHRAHVIVIADAHEDRRCAFGGTGGGWRGCAAKGAGPVLRLAGRAVEHRDLMAGLREMARHGIAHDAEPDECNLFAH